ncbi:MAG: 23S rRNA methyltransferase [Acidimicrobiales bacterium]|nr:MAG: 23S rRNA methyltransferase [Acidimicrobiales bacterium]
MELRVTATARDGAGVARAEDGRVVFVEGALPGETVSVEMLKVDRRWSRARVVRVLDPSPDRVPVPCTHQIEGCGGCDLLHVGESAQLRLKSSMVVDQLARLEIDAPDPARRSLDDDQGRTTVRAAVSDGRAGYRIRGSHDVVVPDSCDAVDPAAEQLLVDGRFGDASEITIRVGNRTGERLVLVEGSPFDIEVPDDVLVVGSADLKKGKRAWIHEEAGGRRWRVSARSFFQNRPAGVDALVDEVREMVDDLGADGPLVDAYAGVGIFAGTIGEGRTVHAIERGRDSIADARVNLDGDVKIIKSSVERWRPSPAAIVVADPAREGLGKDAVATLLRSEPQLFVLVSCDPSSFARDAGLLIDAGMRLDRFTVVDMFPGTSHVETVGAFVV